MEIRQGDNVGIVDTTKDVDLSTWEKRREFNLHPNDRVFDSFIFSKGEYIDIYAETYNELDTNSIIHLITKYVYNYKDTTYGIKLIGISLER